MQFGSSSVNHGIQMNNNGGPGGKGMINRGGATNGSSSKSPNKKSSQITGQALGIQLKPTQVEGGKLDIKVL